MTVFFLLVAWAVLSVLFVSAVLLVIGPGMLLHPYRRTVDYYRTRTPLLHPSDLQLPFEETTLKTPEGLALRKSVV